MKLVKMKKIIASILILLLTMLYSIGFAFSFKMNSVFYSIYYLCGMMICGLIGNYFENICRKSE